MQSDAQPRKRGRPRKYPYANGVRDNAEYQRFDTARVRLELIAMLGGKCRCCEEDWTDFLTIDHVHNDGYLMPQGSRRRYFLIKKELREGKGDRYQVLCANCHVSKSWRGGCTHPAHDLL